MCPEWALLLISTPGSRMRQRFWGDRHGQRPILPSEVPVGSTASSHSRSGAGSCVEPSQPNNFASAPVKSPEPSLSTGRPQRHLCPTTTNPGGRQKSPYPMDLMAKRRHPPQRRCSLRRGRPSERQRLFADDTPQRLYERRRCSLYFTLSYVGG